MGLETWRQNPQAAGQRRECGSAGGQQKTITTAEQEVAMQRQAAGAAELRNVRPMTQCAGKAKRTGIRRTAGRKKSTKLFQPVLTAKPAPSTQQVHHTRPQRYHPGLGAALSPS